MAVRTVSAPLAQLPNLLTLARLCVIPVFAVLILTADGGHSWAAALLFGAAAITDQIDGFLARRWRVESAFGKIADPLADRLLIAVAVIPLRDVLLIAVTPFALGRGYRFEVNRLGKVATWLLYASLGFVMATRSGTEWPLWIFWTGFGVALGSLLLYGNKARKELT